MIRDLEFNHTLIDNVDISTVYFEGHRIPALYSTEKLEQLPPPYLHSDSDVEMDFMVHK